ncbi:hypothetical protein [Helicobacter suis]|uniref:hypothetical protein n=1 Tax=Helicobacter suis TaxID=104628 RepID=UPI0013D3D26C|nr:hypothetical protein [Helicobacter suis]
MISLLEPERKFYLIVSVFKTSVQNYEHTLHLLIHYPQSEEGKKALAILQQK